MSVIKSWYTVAASNQATSPDGEPEGMQRSGVNNSARERAAGVKDYYDSPDFREPFEDYTFLRVTATQFTLTDGSIEAPVATAGASDLLQIGQRVRMVGQGADNGTTYLGFIDSTPSGPSYSSPITTFHVVWDGGTGPTTVPATMEVHLLELGTAAFSNTGTTLAQTPPEIPTADDLDPHVFDPESGLDVGFLDSQTREQITMAAARGRLNGNGDMSIWQRSSVFATGIGTGNDDGDVCADGWTIISDGANQVIVSRDTDAPTGFLYSMRLQSVATGKYGVVYPIEVEDANDVAAAGADQRISASFAAKFDSGSTGIDQIRVYLLNIKNVSPGDPVSAWPGGSGSDFTVNSTGWEIIASTTVTLTGDWQTFTPAAFENIDPDLTASGNGGLAILFHVDEATIAAGSAWFIDAVQINRGAKTLPFIRMPKAWEWNRALRYCETTFVDGTAIGDNQGNPHALQVVCSVDTGAITWSFAQAKYRTPTLLTFNPGVASPTNDWYDSIGPEEVAAIVSVNNTSAQLAFTAASNDGAIYRIAAYVHANIWGNT